MTCFVCACASACACACVSEWVSEWVKYVNLIKLRKHHLNTETNALQISLRVFVWWVNFLQNRFVCRQPAAVELRTGVGISNARTVMRFISSVQVVYCSWWNKDQFNGSISARQPHGKLYIYFCLVISLLLKCANISAPSTVRIKLRSIPRLSLSRMYALTHCWNHMLDALIFLCVF